MPKFVKILQFHSDQGTYDMEGDNTEVNEVLSELQEEGAQIEKVISLPLILLLGGSSLCCSPALDEITKSLEEIPWW